MVFVIGFVLFCLIMSYTISRVIRFALSTVFFVLLVTLLLHAHTPTMSNIRVPKSSDLSVSTGVFFFYELNIT